MCLAQLLTCCSVNLFILKQIIYVVVYYCTRLNYISDVHILLPSEIEFSIKNYF